MDHRPGWRTRNPSIERHANAALAVVCESYVSAVSLSITAQNTIAAREPRNPRCTIASGASHGRIRLTQPGRITQREAVRADGARQLKKHPGVTMPSDTRRKQPSPPHSAVDTRLAAKRAFVGSRLNPKRASQSKRIGPGTRSYTSLNPNPSRTYGKNRLSSAQTAPTTFIRASPGTSTRAISSSPSYRR